MASANKPAHLLENFIFTKLIDYQTFTVIDAYINMNQVKLYYIYMKHCYALEQFIQNDILTFSGSLQEYHSRIMKYSSELVHAIVSEMDEQENVVDKTKKSSQGGSWEIKKKKNLQTGGEFANIEKLMFYALSLKAGLFVPEPIQGVKKDTPQEEFDFDDSCFNSTLEFMECFRVHKRIEFSNTIQFQKEEELCEIQEQLGFLQKLRTSAEHDVTHERHDVDMDLLESHIQTYSTALQTHKEENLREYTYERLHNLCYQFKNKAKRKESQRQFELDYMYDERWRQKRTVETILHDFDYNRALGWTYKEFPTLCDEWIQKRIEQVKKGKQSCELSEWMDFQKYVQYAEKQRQLGDFVDVYFNRILGFWLPVDVTEPSPAAYPPIFQTYETSYQTALQMKHEYYLQFVPKGVEKIKFFIWSGNKNDVPKYENKNVMVEPIFHRLSTSYDRVNIFEIVPVPAHYKIVFVNPTIADTYSKSSKCVWPQKGGPEELYDRIFEERDCEYRDPKEQIYSLNLTIPEDRKKIHSFGKYSQRPKIPSLFGATTVNMVNHTFNNVSETGNYRLTKKKKYWSGARTFYQIVVPIINVSRDFYKTYHEGHHQVKLVQDYTNQSKQSLEREIALSKPSQERIEAYKTLGLEFGADSKEVKKAFRKLSPIHHPDKGGNIEIFQKLVHAKELLLPKVVHNVSEPVTASRKTRKYRSTKGGEHSSSLVQSPALTYAPSHTSFPQSTALSVQMPTFATQNPITLFKVENSTDLSNSTSSMFTSLESYHSENSNESNILPENLKKTVTNTKKIQQRHIFAGRGLYSLPSSIPTSFTPGRKISTELVTTGYNWATATYSNSNVVFILPDLTAMKDYMLVSALSPIIPEVGGKIQISSSGVAEFIQKPSVRFLRHAVSAPAAVFEGNIIADFHFHPFTLERYFSHESGADVSSLILRGIESHESNSIIFTQGGIVHLYLNQDFRDHIRSIPTLPNPDLHVTAMEYITAFFKGGLNPSVTQEFTIDGNILTFDISNFFESETSESIKGERTFTLQYKLNGESFTFGICRKLHKLDVTSIELAPKVVEAQPNLPILKKYIDHITTTNIEVVSPTKLFDFTVQRNFSIPANARQRLQDIDFSKMLDGGQLDILQECLREVAGFENLQVRHAIANRGGKLPVIQLTPGSALWHIYNLRVRIADEIRNNPSLFPNTICPAFGTSWLCAEGQRADEYQVLNILANVLLGHIQFGNFREIFHIRSLQDGPLDIVCNSVNCIQALDDIGSKVLKSAQAAQPRPWLWFFPFW